MRIIREDALPPPDLMEELARIEHQRWTSQAFAAVFEMDEARRKRWIEEMGKPYDALPEKIKQLDRDEVMKYWPAIRAYFGGTT